MFAMACPFPDLEINTRALMHAGASMAHATTWLWSSLYAFLARPQLGAVASYPLVAKPLGHLLVQLPCPRFSGLTIRSYRDKLDTGDCSMARFLELLYRNDALRRGPRHLRRHGPSDTHQARCSKLGSRPLKLLEDRPHVTTNICTALKLIYEAYCVMDPSMLETRSKGKFSSTLQCQRPPVANGFGGQLG